MTNALAAPEIFDTQRDDEKSPVEDTPLKVLDEEGRTDLVVMPDGTSWKFTYDGEQITKARAVNTEVKLGGRSWQDLEFNYDENGNLSGMFAAGNQSSEPRTYLRSENGGFVDINGKEAPFYLPQDGTSFGFYELNINNDAPSPPTILAGPEANI